MKEEAIKIVKEMMRLEISQREKDWNAMLSWVIAELEEKLK